MLSKSINIAFLLLTVVMIVLFIKVAQTDNIWAGIIGVPVSLVIMYYYGKVVYNDFKKK